MILNIRDSSSPALMYMSAHNSKINKDLERLSSGYRINRAADDAAGLAISEAMRSKINGLTQGHQNELEGIGYIQVGDGALSEIHDLLRRMKTLSTQAANGTYTDNNRSMIDSEMQELKTEISRIGNETTYCGVHVFNNKVPTLLIEGEIYDGVTVYNDTNDHYTADKSDDTQDFGGIRIPGKKQDGDNDPVMARRLRWDEIDAKRVDGTGQDIQGKMGQRNTVTGEWEFNPGEYDWTDPETSIKYHFKVEPNAKVPEVSRMHEIIASAAGISIDGNNVQWSDVKDADGNSVAGMSTIQKGRYTFHYSDADISIYVPDTITNGIQGMVDLVNSTQKFAGTGVEKRAVLSSTLVTNYAGTVNEKAADTELYDNRGTTSTLAHMIHNGDLNLSFRADEKGLTLINTDHNNLETVIATKPWGKTADNADDHLKVVDATFKNKDGWDWGKNASASSASPDAGTEKTFNFETTWKPDGYNFNDTEWTISIPIAISNVARDQAVYAAFDGMNINHYNIQTNYTYNNQYAGTTSASESAEGILYNKDYTSITIGFNDEFNNSDRYKNAENEFNSQTNGITFNADTGDVSFSVYKNGTSSTSDTDKWYTMTGNASETLEASKCYVRNALDYMTALKKIMYLNGTDTTSKTSTEAISVNGSTISFDNITNLDHLNSKGFQIESKNASGQYDLKDSWTVRFTSKQADEMDYSTTSSGYRYKLMSPSTGNLLLIDIDSLKTNGVTTDGKNSTVSLAAAIQEISTSAGFYNDSDKYQNPAHYMHADGTNNKNLVIYAQNEVTVTNDPDIVPTEGKYELHFTDPDDASKKWDMLFAYNYGDFQNHVAINVKETAVDSNTYSVDMASGDVIYEKTAVTDANSNAKYTYTRLTDKRKQEISQEINDLTDAKYNEYYNRLTEDEQKQLTEDDIKNKKQELRNESLNEELTKKVSLCKIDVEYTDKADSSILDKNAVIDKVAKAGLESILKNSNINVHSDKNSTTFDYSANENSAGNIAARVQQESEIKIEEGHSNILVQNSNTIGDVTYIPRFSMNAEFLNIGTTNTRTLNNANRAIKQIDNAIDFVSRRRAQFGAAQNALEHDIRNNEVMTENLTSAESRIRDTDMANGVATLMKDQILSQAAQSMLAQANQSRYSMIKLLQ